MLNRNMIFDRKCMIKEIDVRRGLAYRYAECAKYVGASKNIAIWAFFAYDKN